MLLFQVITRDPVGGVVKYTGTCLGRSKVERIKGDNCISKCSDYPNFRVAFSILTISINIFVQSDFKICKADKRLGKLY